MTTSIIVTGMTCGHCASSVREELGDVPGIMSVDVDLATGTVTIASDRPVEDELIRSAVEDAGYQLAG
jgi:copper chaperone